MDKDSLYGSLKLSGLAWAKLLRLQIYLFVCLTGIILLTFDLFEMIREVYTEPGKMTTQELVTLSEEPCKI